MLRAVTIALSLFFASAALAQTAPERPRLTEEQRQRLSADRALCRGEVKPADLPRAERRGAMRRCIEARNPDFAPLFAQGEARRAELRRLRDACRDEIRPKGLRDQERRQAMRSCLVAKRPELAKVFSCLDESRTKNLQPGRERRLFMRACLRA